MRYIAFLLLLIGSISQAQQYNGCVLLAVNQSQRIFYAQFGAVQGFTNGCIVVQQDTNAIYEWNGQAYIQVSGPAGYGLTSLNSQLGQTQIFANDTNITITSSSNTHSLGWAGTLALSRGGTGGAVTSRAGGIVYGASTTALDVIVAGTSGQVLKSNGASAPTWGTDVGITTLNAQTGTTQIFSNDTNITVTSSNNTHAMGWASTLAISRGGTGSGSFSTTQIPYSDGTKLTSDSNFIWDGTNQTLTVTGGATDAIRVNASEGNSGTWLNLYDTDSSSPFVDLVSNGLGTTFKIHDHVGFTFDSTGPFVLNGADYTLGGNVTFGDGRYGAGAAVNINSRPLTNLIEPTNVKDAVPKDYVDTHSPSGTICGWHDGSISVSCQADDPSTSCPTGYTQRVTGAIHFCTAD